MMTDEANLYGFEKSQLIHDNLLKAGAVPGNGRTNSWSAIEKGIMIYQLRWVKIAMKYAAIIIIAFIAGRLLTPSPVADKEISFSEIIVPFGEMSQVKLSDGTKVWLNSGTTLRYPEHFSLDQRYVEVIGEAYFEVAKLANKTFTVNTTDMKVEVLGTSFNVLAYSEDTATSVTLVEGKVVLQNTDGKDIAKLTPGQMATKNKTGTNVAIKNVQTAFYSEWTQGKIFFDDEPLDQIAVKLERWFNVEIIFANENLKTRRFTGTILKNKPVDQIMQALELLSPISFTHLVNATGKDKITIYKKI